MGKYFSRVLVCILVIPFASCERSDTVTIEYNVPAGFRGLFTVRTNESTGMQLPNSSRQYRISVPKSGVVRTKGADPFNTWHVSTTKDENGVRIPNAGQVPDNQTAIWNLGRDSDGTISFFIGTKKEKEEFMNQPFNVD